MPKKLKRISLLLSIIVALLGVVVLIGWVGNISILKSFSPGLTSMKVNTAFCFLFSGVTLILLNRKNSNRTDFILSAIFSAIVFYIGLVTLLQYIFRFNAGIDELLFKDNTVVPGSPDPGRPAPQTALYFVLTGVSLFLINFKKISPVVIQWISLATGTFAFFALVGYLYGASQLTGFSTYTAMAFHTSIGFICLMLAIWFLQPQAGIMKMISSHTMGGRMFRIVFPFIVFITTLLGWVRLQGQLAGWYDTRLGLAFTTISFIIVFAITFFYSSMIVSKGERALKKTERIC